MKALVDFNYWPIEIFCLSLKLLLRVKSVTVMVSLPVILGTKVTDRQSGNFQHSLKTFQTVRKVSGQSKKCSGKLSLGIVSSELCELVQHYFSN